MSVHIGAELGQVVDSLNLIGVGAVGRGIDGDERIAIAQTG